MLPGDLSPYAHPAALAPRTSSDDLDVLGLLVGDSTTRIDMWSNEELGRDLAPEHPVAPCSTGLHRTHNYRRPSRRMCHHPKEAPPSIPPPQLSAALEHVGFSAVDIYDEVCCILPDLRPRSGHRCARVCLVMSTTAGLRENCCCPVFRCGRRTGGDRVHSRSSMRAQARSLCAHSIHIGGTACVSKRQRHSPTFRLSDSVSAA